VVSYDEYGMKIGQNVTNRVCLDGTQGQLPRKNDCLDVAFLLNRFCLLRLHQIYVFGLCLATLIFINCEGISAGNVACERGDYIFVPGINSWTWQETRGASRHGTCNIHARQSVSKIVSKKSLNHLVYDGWCWKYLLWQY
jgi:hypothetical protein